MTRLCTHCGAAMVEAEDPKRKGCGIARYICPDALQWLIWAGPEHGLPHPVEIINFLGHRVSELGIVEE